MGSKSQKKSIFKNICPEKFSSLVQKVPDTKRLADTFFLPIVFIKYIENLGSIQKCVCVGGLKKSPWTEKFYDKVQKT